MAKLGYSTTGGKGLSYSRLVTLHSCARKFEIENVIGYRPQESNMTFAYGHFIGAAVQEYIATQDLPRSIIAGLIEFDLDDPYEEGTYNEQKAKKNFWHAIDVVEKFADKWKSSPELRNNFKDWEVAKFEYKGEIIPALELTFQIQLEDGYTYEGHIDCVLYNRKKDEYMILELKTTGFTTVHRAQFENSAQALSYTIVLDSIVKEKNSSGAFSVLYLVVLSGRKEFEVLKFPKSVVKRAQWINNLLVDVSIIDMYRENSEVAGLHFPQNGSSCYDFFRPCNYFKTCDYSNDRISEFKQADEKSESFSEEEEPMFVFTIEDIIERQQELLASKIPMQQIEESNSDGLEEL